MLEKSVLDGGEICGVKWEAIGVSPACAFELVVSFGSIQASAFSVHPLMLVRAERRQQLALETVLPAIARALDCSSETVVGAAEAIRALPVGDAKVEAGKRVVAAWSQLRASNLRAADDRVDAAVAAA